MDDPSGSTFPDLSHQDMMAEYSSRPSAAPWIWCIEYVAKFKKDLRCLLAMMNMSPECPVDLGKRTNEVLALRILEFMFNPSKKHNDGISVASASGPRIDFDSSLSSIDVLKTILQEIPLAELRPGMSELSKFNVLPFIAHKNSCLPRCALERLRDEVLEENQMNAASSIQAREPVPRDEQPMRMEERVSQAGKEAKKTDQETVHMKDSEGQRNAASFVEARASSILAREPVLRDVQPMHMEEQLSQAGEEVTRTDQEIVHMKDAENQRNAASFVESSEPLLTDKIPRQIAEKPMHMGEETVRINEQAKVIIIDDDDDDDHDEPMHRNEQVKVAVIDDDRGNDEGVQEVSFEQTNSVDSDSSSGRRGKDVRVRCGKDGSWLICGSRDISDTDHRKSPNSSICSDGDISNTSDDPPSSCRAGQDIVCVNCGKDGTLLVCSSGDCSAKVHQECLNDPLWLDENQNFCCPQCRYRHVTSEYLEAKNMLEDAKKKLVEFHGKVSTINKRLKVG